MNRKLGILINTFLALFTFCFGTILLLNTQLVPKTLAVGTNYTYDLENRDFEDDGIIIVLKSESSKFRGITDDLVERLYKIGGKSIKDLSELPEKYVKSDGSINRITAPTLYSYYKHTPFKQIIYMKLLKPGKENVLKTIELLLKFEEVAYAGPNWIEEMGTFIPNDTYYSTQWSLNAAEGIGVESAWDISFGANTVRVGIIDSGIGIHEDLNSNVLDGYDFYNDNNTTNDPLGAHGTHVAGIVSAIGNNALGVSGVAPNVKLVPLQTAYDTAGSGMHYTSDRLDAIQYATGLWEDESQRISILNHSIGGFGTNTDIASAINNFPGLFVWSAGNESENTDTLSAISNFDLPNLISVGALTAAGQRANYSNFGQNSVKIYAPGDSIFSTMLNNNYGYMSGTSMAAPHVTGVAALMLSVNPYLSSSQLKTSILNSADTINVTVPTSSGESIAQTVKKLNAFEAIKSIDPNTNTCTSLDVCYIEGAIQPLSTDNVYIKTSHTIQLVKGTINTITAPNIEGYQFSSWQIECSYPKQKPVIETVCNTKTFVFEQSYISNLKISYRHLYLYAVYNKNSCITEGSLITLSNGDQIPVESLTGDEYLLVWNLETGTFDSAPILFIDHDQTQLYEVINLEFSDGTQVSVIYEHAFWDFNLNEYVFIRSDASKYIGHWFNKQTIDEQGQLAWKRVQLINVNIQEEYTSAWSPITYGHLCYYVNGILSMPAATEGLINIFEVDAENMKYDIIAMENDIVQYGLFSYDEFAQILPITQEVFKAFNAQYFKVAIGKGILKEEKLVQLFEHYSVLLGVVDE